MQKNKNIKEINENIIKKTLKQEAMTLVWIVGITFSVINFIVIPQQKQATDIALIKNSIKKIEENHLAHLQTYAEEIKEIKAQQQEEEKEQTELMKAITAINTKLNMK